MLIKIDNIKISENRRIVDKDKVLQLVDSINEIGLINPITVTKDYVLIAGAHRLAAYKQMGKTHIEANIVELNKLQAELAEIDENLIRNEFHYIDRGEQLKRRKSIYEALHPERRNGGDRRSENFRSAQCASENTKSFVNDISDKIGVSEATIKREIQIVEDLVPSVKEVIKNNDISKSTAIKLSRLQPDKQEPVLNRIITHNVSFEKAKKDVNYLEKREQIYTAPPKEVNGLYDVIYADPPYKYEHTAYSTLTIENHYPTMELEEIKKIQIPAESNSILLLWSPAPKLAEAIQIMESWGIEYRTCAVWDKTSIGAGNWFRSQHEILLLGRKGSFNIPLEENRVSSVYQEKRSKHSKKPDFYYEMIEQMFPNSRYLELFAREKHSEKWAVWGNQI